MSQVLGEAGAVIDGTIARTRRAPPRRRIEGGGVVCHRRIVGWKFADMCAVGLGGCMKWDVSRVAFAMSDAGGRDGIGSGGSDVAHVRAGDD
jgi:hypothetical protein